MNAKEAKEIMSEPIPGDYAPFEVLSRRFEAQFFRWPTETLLKLEDSTEANIELFTLIHGDPFGVGQKAKDAVSEAIDRTLERRGIKRKVA